MKKRFSTSEKNKNEGVVFSSGEVQLEFDRELLIQKRFTLRNLVNSKLNVLALHLNKLTHSDVTWLSRVEDFFFKNDYMTERQVAVIDSIIKRHNLSA